ncbi:MAG: phenylacetate-CoA ligase, partial [Candidatus Methanocomedens sp.]
SGPLFTECTYQDGIHIWADQFLIEVIDPETGEQLADGERGELVVTTLAKEALPLIRYRIGDLTVIKSAPCKCGRTHPRIMRILGRTDDMIIVRGINVFPGQVEAVLMDIPEVAEHYQLVVDREKELDTLTVQVEVTEDVFSDKISDLMVLEKKVTKALQSVLNISARVELVEPGTIPRSMGKAQRVIDNRKI